MNSHWNELRYWTDGKYRRDCRLSDVNFKFDTAAKAIKDAPDDTVIGFASTLFSLGAEQENIHLTDHTIIPNAVTHVLTASIKPERDKGLSDILTAMTDGFLNRAVVHCNCRHGKSTNLSEPMALWLPTLKADTLTPAEKLLLYTVAVIGHDFSQQVTDIAAARSEDFRQAAAQTDDLRRRDMLNHAVTLTHHIATRLGVSKPGNAPALDALAA